jgi:RNA-directed DNA polymerase
MLMGALRIDGATQDVIQAPNRSLAIYCRKNNVFETERDAWISTNLLFHRRHGSSKLTLSIGAPSSPCLSNISMNDFDTQLADRVSQDKVTYTRYADDLPFWLDAQDFLPALNERFARLSGSLRDRS